MARAGVGWQGQGWVGWGAGVQGTAPAKRVTLARYRPNDLPWFARIVSRSLRRGQRLRPQKRERMIVILVMMAATSGILAMSLSSSDRTCVPQPLHVSHGKYFSRSAHAACGAKWVVGVEALVDW